jgi:hypothetical protein
MPAGEKRCREDRRGSHEIIHWNMHLELGQQLNTVAGALSRETCFFSGAATGIVVANTVDD